MVCYSCVSPPFAERVTVDLLINGFGIFTNAAGAKIAWFIDPMGAIIISCVIIASWSWTAYSELSSQHSNHMLIVHS